MLRVSTWLRLQLQSASANLQFHVVEEMYMGNTLVSTRFEAPVQRILGTHRDVHDYG